MTADPGGRPIRDSVDRRLREEFGTPLRNVAKVRSWNVGGHVGVVLQVDQPNREDAAYVWLPHPGDGRTVPGTAVEYPAEAGRHSGTYPAAGLKRGEPALKLTIRGLGELDDLLVCIAAMVAGADMPSLKFGSADLAATPRSAPGDRVPVSAGAPDGSGYIDPATMPKAEPPKPRREAIPRSVQREVWQRDGGRCVQCALRERLCFDHIVPFSRGGGNSVRNIQLLCEGCNLSKGNRL